MPFPPDRPERLQSNTCEGEIDDIDVLIDRSRVLTRGAKLSGQAWAQKGRSTLRGIVISDEAGEVIGLGAMERTAAPTAKVPPVAGTGWIAYTHPPIRGGRVNIWGRIDDRVVCRIAGPVTI